ncbi:TPA: hypothetical protein ACG1QB_003889 [Enterobacter asburiae]
MPRFSWANRGVAEMRIWWININKNNVTFMDI